MGVRVRVPPAALLIARIYGDSTANPLAPRFTSGSSVLSQIAEFGQSSTDGVFVYRRYFQRFDRIIELLFHPDVVFRHSNDLCYSKVLLFEQVHLFGILGRDSLHPVRLRQCSAVSQKTGACGLVGTGG